MIVSGDAVTAERGIFTAHIPHHIDIESELAQLMTQIAGGEIKLEIEQVYPFADGIAALQKTQTRHARGKVVIAMPGGD